jgi:hypothetical protein
VLRAGRIAAPTAGLDEAQRTLLISLVYRLGDPGFQVFAQPLAGPVDVPELPDGFRLLDEVTDEWVAERGVEVAGVHTWAGHASSIPFYESCGFERTTTIDRFTRPG